MKIRLGQRESYEEASKFGFHVKISNLCAKKKWMLGLGLVSYFLPDYLGKTLTSMATLRINGSENEAEYTEKL